MIKAYTLSRMLGGGHFLMKSCTVCTVVLRRQKKIFETLGRLLTVPSVDQLCYQQL